MPVFEIEESVKIDKSLGGVRPFVADFAKWPEWSPWIYMEPDALVTPTGRAGEPGHAYSWKGKIVGAGNMQITRSTETEIDMNLQFTEPFKSKSKVFFELRTDGQKTEVTWKMKGSLPFFLFWMKKQMVADVSADYRRGLWLLKNLAESGHVGADTEIVGEVVEEEKLLLAKEASGAVSDLASVFKRAFAPLEAHMEKAQGPVHTVVRHFDLKSNECRVLVGIPVSSDVSCESNLILHRVPKGRAFKGVHTGAYEGLANAWCKVKANAGKHWKGEAYEVYLNDPANTSPDNLKTEIYLR